MNGAPRDCHIEVLGGNGPVHTSQDARSLALPRTLLRCSLPFVQLLVLLVVDFAYSSI